MLCCLSEVDKTWEKNLSQNLLQKPNPTKYELLASTSMLIFASSASLSQLPDVFYKNFKLSWKFC